MIKDRVLRFDKTIISKHDIIESYYVPNMRFNEIEDLKHEIIKRTILLNIVLFLSSFF